MDERDHAAGRTLLSLFGRVWIINLPGRTDRRAGIARELGRIGLALDHPAVTLFPAIRPADPGGFPCIGIRGCFESHRAVLAAIAAGAEGRGLILEDDAGLEPGFGGRLAAIADRIAAEDWGFCFGFYSGSDGRGSRRLAPGLIEVAPQDGLTTAHFFAVRSGMAAELVPYLDAIAARPLGHPDGGPMHVDGAYNWFRRARPDITRTLAADPPLSRQRPSRSDIQEQPWFDRIPALAGAVDLGRRIKRALGTRRA